MQTKKGNKTITDKIICDIKNLFELENEDYYKPIRLDNFYSNHYIELEPLYRVMKIEIKNLSIEEYLNTIKPLLKDITIDLHKSDSWNIQLTIAINFISF